MPEPLKWMLAAGGLLIAAGLALLFSNVLEYLANPLAINSSAGLMVFTVNGALVSYLPFVLGAEPLLIGVGVVLVVASVFLTAALWRPRV